LDAGSARERGVPKGQRRRVTAVPTTILVVDGVILEVDQ